MAYLHDNLDLDGLLRRDSRRIRAHAVTPRRCGLHFEADVTVCRVGQHDRLRGLHLQGDCKGITSERRQ